jgi:hypothetical protein
MGLTQVFYALLLAALFAALVIFFKAAFTGLRWQARYFEAGSDVAYQTETFFSQATLEDAVAIYSRLGGDDVLIITGPDFQP